MYGMIPMALAAPAPEKITSEKSIGSDAGKLGCHRQQ